MNARISVSILAFAFVGSAALAHDYDPNKVVTLTGTVKEVKWEKPYVKIHLSVKENSGKTKDWELETATPDVLESDGFARTSFKKGDRITVEGQQASNGSEHALVTSITMADGRTLSLRGAQAQVTAAAAAPAAQTRAATPPPAPQDSSNSALPQRAPQDASSSALTARAPQDASSSTLPKTATNMPLIALMGLLALGAGTFLSILRATLSK